MAATIMEAATRPPAIALIHSDAFIPDLEKKLEADINVYSKLNEKMPTLL